MNCVIHEIIESVNRTINDQDLIVNCSRNIQMSYYYKGSLLLDVMTHLKLCMQNIANCDGDI